MRVNINGIYRDADAQEIAQFERMQAQASAAVPDTVRIAALEEELRAAKILLGLEE